MIVVVELPATLDAVQETSFIHQHDDDDDDDDYDILIYIHMMMIIVDWNEHWTAWSEVENKGDDYFTTFYEVDADLFTSCVFVSSAIFSIIESMKFCGGYVLPSIVTCLRIN